VEWQFVNLPDTYATQKTIVSLMIEKLMLFFSEFPRHTSSRKHFKKTTFASVVISKTKNMLSKHGKTNVYVMIR